MVWKRLRNDTPKRNAPTISNRVLGALRTLLGLWARKARCGISTTVAEDFPCLQCAGSGAARVVARRWKAVRSRLAMNETRAASVYWALKLKAGPQVEVVAGQTRNAELRELQREILGGFRAFNIVVEARTGRNAVVRRAVVGYPRPWCIAGVPYTDCTLTIY